MKARVWKRADGEWHWRFESKGRITADSESFPTKANAMRACKGVITAVFKATQYRQASGTMTRLEPQYEVSKEEDGVVWVTWYL